MESDRIATAIQKARLSSGLTQKQVATALDKSQTTVAAWETGRAQPSATTIVQLSELFNVSTDYLLGLSLVERPQKGNCVANELRLKGLSEQDRQIIDCYWEKFVAFCVDEASRELTPTFPFAIECLNLLLDNVSDVTELFRTCQKASNCMNLIVDEAFYSRLSDEDRKTIEKLAAIATAAPTESVFAYDSLTYAANCAGAISLLALKLQDQFSEE